MEQLSIIRLDDREKKKRTTGRRLFAPLEEGKRMDLRFDAADVRLALAEESLVDEECM